MTISDYIWQYLYDYGVRHVFTLAGGGSMYLVDALARSKITPIYCLHEQSCAIAADGYAQYTGKLGVCLVTTGPGSTNAITGVVASWIDSTPVLIISGQVMRKHFKRKLRQSGPQSVDITTIVQSVTKRAILLWDTTWAEETLEEIIKDATTDRKGPVWLDIPLDIQNESVDSG